MLHRYAPLRRAASALALLSLGLLAADADAQAYRAFLNGANEVPPVETTGSGIVTADVDGSTVTVGGYFEGLKGEIQAAHLHLGPAGENGPVIFPLVVSAAEDPRSGRFNDENNAFSFSAEQLDALAAGEIYVNVHSSFSPDGEIRGQLNLLDGVIPIDDARDQGAGATVTVQGVVSRAKGQFAWFEDGTGGLVIRQTSGAFFDAVANGDIQAGTLLEVSGEISEFPSAPRGGILQFNEGGLTDFSISGELEPPLPQSVTIDELLNNGEAYESELVRLAGVNVNAEPGETFSAGTSYDLSDRENVFDFGLRIGNAENTDVDGLEVPDGQIIVTGPVGQFTPSSNPDPAAGYQVLPIEEVDVLPFVRAAAQVIHNSPDPAAAVVDVYVDVLGDNEPVMMFDDVAFRSATEFLPLPSDLPVRLFIAPSTSDGPEDAIFERTYDLESDDTVVLIASGVLDPSQFADSPSGADISFDVVAIPGQIEAGDVTEVAVNVFHGAPDVGPVTVSLPGSGSLPPIVEDLAYGNASGYATLAPQETTLLVDAEELPTQAAFTADLEPFAGLGIVALASGFLSPDDNQDGEGLGLLVVTPLGDAVFLEPAFPDSNEEDAGVLAFALDGSYPNPVAQTARVRVALPTAATVGLTLYDVLGREVARTETEAAAGRMTLPLDASTLAPGAYVYRVRAEDAAGTVHVGTGRLTVVR
jgi:hypothetical protein